jgi:hypothetical protein
MADDRQLSNDDALVEVAPAMKPLRGGSSFAVSTAQREVHGDPLHRTELPPTLQGFFFCGRNHDVDGGDGNGNGDHYDGEETEEDDAPLPYLLPPKRYGQFAELLGNSAAPIVDLDPSFSFITKALPEIDYIYLIDSCNGLLLFGHLEDAHNTPETCYVVCNPATEQWVAVPGCGRIDLTRRRSSSIMHTYLLFDPAISSHFNIVLFWENPMTTTAHAYSSETGEWIGDGQQIGPPLEHWRYRNDSDRLHIHATCPGSVVDGMLYLIYDSYWIFQVDAQAKTRRKLTAPRAPEVGHLSLVFIGQSQGRLHCIMEEGTDDGVAFQLSGVHLSWKSTHGISVWVLQDLDTQEWVLKGRVSYLELFGKMDYIGNVDYRVSAMHPDCNLLFFVQHWNCKMVSYDIDSQEVRALDIDFHHDYEITPYVPYVSELFRGVIGGHKLAH